MAIPMRPQGARGVICGDTIEIVKGACGYSIVPNKGKPMGKQDIYSRVNLCKKHVVIFWPHTTEVF
jgi:hypothetical protein